METFEQKYNRALERARELMKTDTVWDATDLCQKIFSELNAEPAESQDEKIIKTLKEVINTQFIGTTQVLGVEKQEIYTWLEKQGEQDKASYDIAEKEKYDFVSGQFIECRKSFNEFKEDNSYWLEYVGNDTYIGRSDNILNKKFHITPRQLYRLFTQEHCYKEDNANEETNAPFSLMKIFDLRTLYKRLNELKAQKGEQL